MSETLHATLPMKVSLPMFARQRTGMLGSVDSFGEESTDLHRWGLEFCWPLFFNHNGTGFSSEWIYVNLCKSVDRIARNKATTTNPPKAAGRRFYFGMRPCPPLLDLSAVESSEALAKGEARRA